jgi:hypothetical protein
VTPFAFAAPNSTPSGTREARQAPALEGDLARFVAGDVLQFLRLAGASGRLECERGDERVEMAFAHGRPLWASTTGRAVRVGDVLLHRGWAAPAALDEALNDQRRRPGRRIGEHLRERGVPLECIAASVGEVFRRLVCLLSLWPDGRFRFVPGEATPVDDVELELELDRLLLEGLHQADLTQGTA